MRMSAVSFCMEFYCYKCKNKKQLKSNFPWSSEVTYIVSSGALNSTPTKSRQITMLAPHHSVFYRPDALPAAQPIASMHWRHYRANNQLKHKDKSGEIRHIKYAANHCKLTKLVNLLNIADLVIDLLHKSCIMRVNCNWVLMNFRT